MTDLANGAETSPAAVYRGLHAALDHASVAHAYWKPHTGLGNALKGHGKDYDLLVDKQSLGVVHAALAKLGWKRFRPATAGNVPGSEHWLFAHASTHQLLHLHLHVRLPLGSPPFFEYEVASPSVLLKSTQLTDDGIRLLRPAAAFALGVLRASCEQKLQDPTGQILPAFDSYLAQQRRLSNDNQITEVLAHLLAHDRNQVQQALSENGESMNALARKLRAWLPRSTSEHGRRLHRLQRSSADFLESRLTQLPRVHRTSRRGLRTWEQGCIVALVGPDGAGKSTLLDSLLDWLAPLDVHTIHLGRGDAFSDALKIAADIKWKLLHGLGHTAPPASPATHAEAPTTGRDATQPHVVPQARLHHLGMNLALAERKVYDIRRANKLRAEGAVVVTDRFPLGQSPHLDGAKLGLYRDDAKTRFARSIESALYAQMRKVVPDLVIRLVLEPEECIRRKPDHNEEEVRRKAEAVYALSKDDFPIFDIDATLPASEVFDRAANAIWELC